MTRVHVVNRFNTAQYKDQLTQYFRLRHDVFVGERGWQDLRQDDGLERDAYDNAEAIYLLAIDNGRVVGGQRLYPTLLPHMMSETFASLASRDLPRSATIFEWTRYFVVRERRMGRTDCRLLAAMQDYCLSVGITHVTAVVEMWWLPRWQQAGFDVRPLGLPTPIEGEPCVAACIRISQASLDHVRRIAGLRGPSLDNHNPVRILPVEAPHVAA